MACAGHHAVVLIAGIEMAAGGFERCLAFADRVEVKGMLAGRQALELKLDQDASGRLGEVDVADRLAALVFELGHGEVIGGRYRHRDGGGQ